MSIVWETESQSGKKRNLEIISVPVRRIQKKRTRQTLHPSLNYTL